MRILKEEINMVSEQLLSLAKWKITVVASIAAIGLGLSGLQDDSSPNDSRLLLLYSVGYLCAYIDFMSYGRYADIHKISAFIRSYHGANEESTILKNYELNMLNHRNKSTDFISERWAQFLSSLLFSIGLPIIGFNVYDGKLSMQLIIPITAIIFIILLFYLYEKVRNVYTKFHQSE
ncbi:MAG: hypothetical protein V3U87_01065 [Methylococcaceae bacterium]